MQSCSARQGLGLKEGMDWLATAVRGKKASSARLKRSSSGGTGTGSSTGAGTGVNELEGLAPPPAFPAMGAPISSS